MSSPECEINSRIQKKMITGIKAAVYLKIHNADDLIRAVEDREIDFTVRSGPGTPEVSIKVVQAGRVFKIEYTMFISGRYCIALSCRKKRIQHTPFSVRMCMQCTCTECMYAMIHCGSNSSQWLLDLVLLLFLCHPGKLIMDFLTCFPKKSFVEFGRHKARYFTVLEFTAAQKIFARVACHFYQSSENWITKQTRCF